MTDLWSFRALAPVLRALFAIEFVVLPLAGVGCLLRAGRGEPGGSSLSFASPKESNQRKGDPQSGAPAGQPVNLAKTGGPRKLAALRQRAGLIPVFAKFTGPARTGCGGNAGVQANAGLRSEVTNLWSFRALARVLWALFAIECVVLPLAGVGCLSRRGRGEPGGSSLFFGYRPKKSNQKKGDPAVCVPSLRFGQPAVLSKSGVTCKLAALRQARALIRFYLRSSAHTEGFFGMNSDSDSDFELPDPLPKPVLAGPVMRHKSGIRAARCLSRRRVCADPRFSGAAQVARRAPDCGSPFFSLGFFGEAKKSKSPAGARPGLLAKGAAPFARYAPEVGAQT